MAKRIQRLLGQAYVEGVQGIERQIGPVRRALAVSPNDVGDAVKIIGRICQQ
jgi:hypothetical protein